MNSEKARTRNRRSRKTETAVLDAALSCFHEQGVLATSMDAIAERADVARATIYYNFASKDEIAVRIAERFRADGYAAYVRQRDSGGDALTLIESFFEFAGAWVSEHREVAMIGTLAAVRGVGRNPERPPTTQVFHEMVELGQKQQLIRQNVNAWTLAGILAGILTQSALVGRRDDGQRHEDQLLDMVRVVLGGVRVHPVARQRAN